jgi:CheY-like chemotaxis protein
VTRFSGIKVLVVEDEGVIAMMIEDMLEELGCEVVASVAGFAQAREIAARAEIDLAMLDVNVAGQLVFPVAEILRDRRIPMLFSTGYGASGLPTEFQNYLLLTKPFSRTELQQKMALMLGR